MPNLRGLLLKDCTHILSQLRIIKDEEEIKRIRRAAIVAEKAMEAAIKAMRPGVTESQIAAEAEYTMRQAGAEEFWRSYVSSGPRTNIAHGLPTRRKIKKGDLVMIDLSPSDCQWVQCRYLPNRMCGQTLGRRARCF